jgi:hypothetical protein
VFAGSNTNAPASVIFPDTTTLSDVVPLNSIVVVELSPNVTLPSIVRVPILFPGAKLAVATVTFPPIVAPPDKVPPLTITLFSIT